MRFNCLFGTTASTATDQSTFTSYSPSGYLQFNVHNIIHNVHNIIHNVHNISVTRVSQIHYTVSSAIQTGPFTTSYFSLLRHETPRSHLYTNAVLISPFRGLFPLTLFPALFLLEPSGPNHLYPSRLLQLHVYANLICQTLLF